ncbi:hypothetical protein Q4489_17320 [Thalassotalea sp. 1_MG-2023]|uniref:hypothetical protein n=1 Tax=Thalassotalea sp. 1_MG-2023 TaxID=3062680 RepID=UPI0026E3A17B|nr:hypothetical protein [Thalassotalea sp. 1_MG-2023]MDO6428772.1 hypothetical protein [Thalassotalea sp. 1_MG-2023]
MKNIVVSSFFMIFVASCASNGDVSHWHGESLGTLIEEYGTPQTFLKLEDGNKVIEYDGATALHKAANYCSLTFMIDRQNKILGASRQGNGTNCSNF